MAFLSAYAAARAHDYIFDTFVNVQKENYRIPEMLSDPEEGTSVDADACEVLRLKANYTSRRNVYISFGSIITIYILLPPPTSNCSKKQIASDKNWI